MRKFLITALFLQLFALAAYAQMRPVEKDASPSNIKPAPASFKAKYQGGLFGFSKKTDGTLKFDDANERIVFFDKEGKELFGMPYGSLIVITPQSNSVTSTTGSVISHIPLPGAGLASLIKEKRRYLVIQFSDPDADARGIINFKLENKELLESVIRSLGEKAKMKPRGDSYYRPRNTTTDI